MFKSLSVALATIALISLTPVKKAEAGTVLMATAYATGGTGLMVLGGNLAGIAAPVAGVIGMLHERSFIWVALGLLVLDETSQIKEFKTLPPYLVNELEGQTIVKAEMVVANEKGIKEVVFTHEEVDAIFELADEETSIDELELLRSMLTTKTLN